jgi:hypothetical protein
MELLRLGDDATDSAPGNPVVFTGTPGNGPYIGGRT